MAAGDQGAPLSPPAQHTAELHQVKLRGRQKFARRRRRNYRLQNEKCPALPGIVDEFLF
jgi:hypothetical protein